MEGHPLENQPRFDPKHQKVVEALAEYYGVEPDAIGGHVLGVEHQLPDGSLRFATIWSGTTWDLKGYVQEIQDQIKHEMAQRQMENFIRLGADS
jgi:hypothetical protein